MSTHPINLTVRFLLELAGLFAMGFWGWTQHEGVMRFVWAAGLVVGASVVWGVFRIDNEPGKAPVPVHGIVRLVIEAAFFGGAVWCLVDAGAMIAAWVLGAIVVIHYATSYDRVLRMLRNEKAIPPTWPAVRG
jgi:hypothetical protein